MKHLKLFLMVLTMLSVQQTLALAGGDGGGDAPEIPAGASSIIVIGLLGATLWLRNFFGKK